MASRISRAASAAFLLCGSILMIATSVQAASSVLVQPYTLKAGQSLRQGRYGFIMQQDCNLVLYNNGYPIWASNTGGLSSWCYFVMQRDGNGVVYSQQNYRIWATKTSGKSGAYIVVQCDGNVVMYTGSGSPIWATNTGGRVEAIDLEEGNSLRKPSTDSLIVETFLAAEA